jgi:cardiolipin synthase
MRSVFLLLVGALVSGCATLPDVHPWSSRRDTDVVPTVVGSRGQPLRPEQVAKVLARIRGKVDSDVLTRHLAIEEEISGRPLTLGNSATLLRDGPASYQAMFDAIASARDHVNVEFYIIEDDEIGRRFSDALLQKAAEGVAVNLMYDSVGSNQASSDFFERLRKGGVNVLEFNPVNPLRARGAWRANNRDHRKLVIVDGQVAFTGGYPFAADTPVTLEVEGTEFTLLTRDEWAWPANAEADARIVEAFRDGSEAVLTGQSERGTVTRDTFSLVGFSRSVEEAEDLCAS